MNDPHDHIEKRLRAFYEAQALDDAALRDVKAQGVRSPNESDKSLGADRAPQSRAIPRMVSWRAAVGVGALLFAIVAVVAVWYMNQAHTADRMQQIAAEIVLNHEKQLAPDMRPDAFSTLVAEMEKLDFEPVEPVRIQQGPYRLAGARYCSIGESIAAQVHLSGSDGERCTMYQFRPTDPKDLPNAITLEARGVPVQLWREGPLLNGLVCTAS